MLGLALSVACLSLFDGLIQRYLVVIIAVATLSTFAFQIAGIYELQAFRSYGSNMCDSHRPGRLFS